MAGMNLQFFAAQVTTQQSLSAEMRTFYEKTLIDLAEPKLVHDQFGDKYPIPRAGGKIIQFRRYAPLSKATSPITEGVTPPGSSLSVSSQTATVAQYGDFIQLSDMLEMTAVDNNVVQATRLLGSQAGRTLDTLTRDVLVGGTNVIYAPNVSGGTATAVTSRKNLDSTSLLSADLFFKAAAQLGSMNAEPIDDSYVAIIHPYAAYDLMRTEEWIDAHKYATPEAIYHGEIGKIGNVRFVRTSEAKIVKSANLTAASRTLKVRAAVTANASVPVAEAITSAEATALAGRVVSIGGTAYTVSSATSGAAGSASLTLATAVTAAANAIVYPADTGIGGIACFLTLVLGAHAYATTEVEGGGLSHIVKQLGYGDDPLNQRASCGWKATKAVRRLVEEYMVRIESASSYSGSVTEN